MKKYIATITLSIVSCVVLLCSCGGSTSQNKAKHYSLYIVLVSAEGREMTPDPIDIIEKSDTAAYLSACEFVESFEKRTKESLKGDESDDYVLFPQSFTLKDSTGEIVYFENVETEEMKAKRERNLQEQKKVFADAEFGMTKSQVKALDFYKTWSSEGNILQKSSVSVGNETCWATMYFKDDALYMMTFQSNYPRSASHLNTEILSEINNFTEIIKKAYGRPTRNYGIPSISRLSPGYISWAYVWEIGAKTISIGIREESTAPKYEMYVEILDTIVEKTIKEEEEAAKNNKIEEASHLF